MAGTAVKHYRVAQKEVEKKEGTLIPKERENTVILIVAVALLLVFFKGIIIGIGIGRRR